MDNAEFLSQTLASDSQDDNDQEMMDLLDASEQGYGTLRRGEITEGVVVQITRDEILVDVGTKAEAVIPAHEAGVPAGELDTVATIGETILAMVVETEGREGHATLSLARAQSERGWRSLQKTFDDALTVDARVVDFNKGGLIVNVEGARGFVPLSQVVDLRQPVSADEPVEARLERMKGRTLSLKVIEMNRRRNRLILSERAADQERRARDREQLMVELEEGQVRPGRVSSLCDFGAFVDLGGADGLIHLSELAWTPVANAAQVVQPGDEVEVMVLNVDRERRKIALSLKRLQPEPWAKVADKYQIGALVPARVTKLVTFGAFAQLEPGIEGLIHISELSDERIMHPKSVVQEGETVTVKVLRIDQERRRLGLSLRQARAETEAEETESLPMVYGDTDDAEADRGWMGGARVSSLASERLREPIAEVAEVDETVAEAPGALTESAAEVRTELEPMAETATEATAEAATEPSAELMAEAAMEPSVESAAETLTEEAEGGASPLPSAEPDPAVDANDDGMTVVRGPNTVS